VLWGSAIVKSDKGSSAVCAVSQHKVSFIRISFIRESLIDTQRDISIVVEQVYVRRGYEPLFANRFLIWCRGRLLRRYVKRL